MNDECGLCRLGLVPEGQSANKPHVLVHRLHFSGGVREAYYCGEASANMLASKLSQKEIAHLTHSVS